MNRGRLSAWAVIIATLIVASLTGWGGALLSAAQGTPQPTATVLRVEAEAPWSVDAIVVSGDTTVIKVDGAYANVLIGSFPVNTPVEEADAALVGPYADQFDEVEVVESGVSGGVPYTVNLVTIDGETYGAFSLYYPRTTRGVAEGYAYLAPISRFGEGLFGAKQSITVNGTPIFEGVDGEGLELLLERNADPVSVIGGGPAGASPPPTPSRPPPTRPPGHAAH